jgi:4,5-DOPA dioxygenase extradiol
VWIVGSGGATHHLGRMDWNAPPGEAPPDIRAFADWLVARVEAGDTEALVEWETTAPHPQANHPTPEHFLPLFVPLGAVGENARGRAIHRAFAYGALALDAFQWE